MTSERYFKLYPFSEILPLKITYWYLAALELLVTLRTQVCIYVMSENLRNPTKSFNPLRTT